MTEIDFDFRLKHKQGFLKWNGAHGFDQDDKKHYISIDFEQIWVGLGSKNQDFKSLVSEINDIFLVEYICFTLQDLNIWNKKLCKDCKPERCVYYINRKKDPAKRNLLFHYQALYLLILSIFLIHISLTFILCSLLFYLSKFISFWASISASTILLLIPSIFKKIHSNKRMKNIKTYDINELI